MVRSVKYKIMNYQKEISVLDKGFCKYISHHGDDAMIPRIARVSTGSENKGDEQDKKLLNYLYKNFHSSPFEFANITYLLKLPLFARDQIVRHRTAKVNIMSLRYQEAKDEFYIPSIWRRQDTKSRQSSIIDDTFEPRLEYAGEEYTNENVADGLNEFSNDSYAVYNSLVKSGVAKEMARVVLGTNLYTYMYIQFDLNNLIKFFRLRIHSHAQYEVRCYAEAMFEIFQELFPWCAECYDKYKMQIKEV